MTALDRACCYAAHDESSEPCRTCGFVSNWFGAKLAAAGTTQDAPHVLVAFRMFAVTDVVQILKAFEHAGRAVQEVFAAAYDLGGEDAARQYVWSLALPGVAVPRHGWIFWDPPGATDVRHEGAA